MWPEPSEPEEKARDEVKEGTQAGHAGPPGSWRLGLFPELEGNQGRPLS